MARSDFELVSVAVEDLLLDIGNARIRAGVDQRDCIQRILTKEDQMIALMQDIAENGLTTMPILVSPTENSKWIVWDGNRRTTALQLLRNPDICPVEHLKPRIRAIASKYSNNAITHVDCLSSTNIEALINEVTHRHAGALGGAGQLDWHAYMKTVFFLNHDKAADYKKAGQYLLWAEANGLVVEDTFPITSIHRFFTVQNLEKLGFGQNEAGELELQINVNLAKKMAAKIIYDFGGGKPVREVFEPEAASEYLEQVRAAAGLTPSNSSKGEPTGEMPNEVGKERKGPEKETNKAQDENNNPQIPASKDGSPSPSLAKPLAKGTKTLSWERQTLFPRNKDGLPIPYDHEKAKNIVGELRRLKTSGEKATPIAVAMLLRALLEISTDRYFRVNQDLKDVQDFHIRIAKAADHMRNNGLIDGDQHAVILRHSREQESILHVKTIQKYVHSPAFHPNGQTLNSLWDEISVYIGACWRAQPSV